MSAGSDLVSPSGPSGYARLHVWLAVAAIAFAAIALMLFKGDEGRFPSSAPAAQADSLRMSPGLQSLLRETNGPQAEILSRGEVAARRNALIPISRVALQPSHAFSIRAGTPAYDTALKCLTQAVYYEAANEPLEGKRAVAQVVLNRVLHPAYPDTVCGVVYQGSNEAICQFSFTCDGSLLRNPLPAQWAQSRAVAAAALGGFVESSVGPATHYHADYVLPRWAYSLGKIEQLGRHIFYRFKGSEGSSAFLTARWSGEEVIPKLDLDRLRRGLSASEDMPSAPELLASGSSAIPQVTDRHAENDIGGRIDTTKAWRPSIPDPVAASRSLRETIDGQRQGDKFGLAGGAGAHEPG